LNRWRKKFSHLSESHFEVDFRSRKNVSKHHPQGFQRKVVMEMEKRKEMIFDQTGVLVPAIRWEWTCENDVKKT
jgi:ribosomal protein L32E